MFSVNIWFSFPRARMIIKVSLVLIFWQIAREMQQTMDDMGQSAFPVRPGETFHMTVSYSGYY